MAVSFSLLQFSKRSENIKPAKSFESFPSSIESWEGSRYFFDQKVYDVLGVDDSVAINYTNPENKMVQLYIGFYQSQKEGDLIHSPKNCMPGSGWNIVESGIEKVNIESLDKSIRVIRLKLQKGSQKQFVLYWFHSRGRIISSEYMQKIWLVIDSVTRRRTDGSFVRLVSPVYENEKETLEILKNFTSSLYPYLKKYIPS